MAKKAAKTSDVINPLDPPPCKMVDCTLCSCRREARQPVPGRGSVDAEVMFVGTNPTGDEDTQRQVFLGESGKELRKWLQVLGLPETSIYLTNLVKCHTKDNRPPTAKEYKMCRGQWLERETLRLPKLKAIISLGKVPKHGIIGAKKQGQTGVAIDEASVATVKDASGRELVVFPVPAPTYYLRAAQTEARQGLAPDRRNYLKRVILPEIRRELERLGVQTKQETPTCP